MNDYTYPSDHSTANIDLAAFDGEFENLPEEADDAAIPDGKYQARIESLEVTRSKTSGNPMLKWKLRIVAPRFAGRVLWRNSVLRNDAESLRWIKKDLAAAGLRVTRLSELPAHAGSVSGRLIEISKTTRGEYESIYLNKLIDSGGAPGMDGASTPGSPALDDGLPF